MVSYFQYILCLLSLFIITAPGAASALSSFPSIQTGLIELSPVVSEGLEQPVFLTHAGDHSGRLFVIEQEGRIRVIQGGTLLPDPFLDITNRVRSGGERGLLGLAFHPHYPRNGRYGVNYTRAKDAATVISEFRVSANPNRSDQHETIVLEIPQPYSNHNGGMVAFGPDGFLYIGMGDGGAGGDPENRAQNLTVLLGKILRIDVDHGAPYAIPDQNPISASRGRPEIFALGLRNPWRFSFDRQTGVLWAADVGQNAWEEVNHIQLGGNYGWRIMEGSHCFLPKDNCSKEPFMLPVIEYQNSGARCAITGGYVYRGRAIPALSGMYIFGDYCSGEIMGWVDGTLQVLLSTGRRISSFGEDESGELYLVDHGGTIQRLGPFHQGP